MKSKVLLIDDSVTIHRVIDLSIDVDRYDIVKVFSKEDAAIKMQSEQFDYILLDNKLDNIIITEYIKELKAAQPSAEIILLVGAFDRFNESDLEKTGADDYLVKPFDSQSLNEKLSSDADMMPAGIVEKIAEADFARDNDDYIAPAAAASITGGEANEVLSKQEYLENLEEVQPEDLTDNGYVEDLDNAPSTEFDTAIQKAEENAQNENTAQENIIDEPAESDEVVEETSYDEAAEENPANVVDETVLEDIKEEIPEGQETEVTAAPVDTAEVPVMDEKEDAEEIKIEEPAEENIETTEENNEVQEEAEPVNESAARDETAIPDNITAVHNPVLPDISDAAEISDEYLMQDNLAPVDNDGQEMLDEFPDFPEMDDVTTDELQDEMESAPVNESEEKQNEEMPVSFEENEPAAEESAGQEEIEQPEEETEPVINNEPFAETEEPLETETLNQDNAEEDNNAQIEENELQQEEIKAEEKEESLLVDDDDWLSDAPKIEEEQESETEKEPENVEMYENNNEELPAEDSEERADNDLSALEDITAQEESAENSDENMAVPQETMQEEEQEEPALVETAQENIEETSDEQQAEENIENIETNSEPVTFESEVDSADTELPEMPGVEEIANMSPLMQEETAENNEQPEEKEIPAASEDETDNDLSELEDITAQEESAENMDDSIAAPQETVQEETAPLSNELPDEIPAEEISAVEENQPAAEEITEVKEEPQVEETAVQPKQEPVINQAAQQESSVKQAETYSPENTGRFGGITVTISRDEIMAMLGNAIDKSFLEEAVKEVIAANMKDIVRNIVPAIAEKYIKEEIERLKNDE